MSWEELGSSRVHRLDSGVSGVANIFSIVRVAEILRHFPMPIAYSESREDTNALLERARRPKCLKAATLVPSPSLHFALMDDPQWCLDECPTCATVVQGPSVYCSSECEPDSEPEELRLDDVPWSQYNSTRISAWAVHCYKSSHAAGSPCIFPSPSRRKLYLRKKHPTSWVTSDISFDPPPYVSSSISTGTAIESLVTSSTAPPSPVSRWSVRSWTSPSPGPPTPPLLTKTNVFLAPESAARQQTATRSYEASEPAAQSYETSAYPTTPSEASTPAMAGAKDSRGRPSRPMLKQRRRTDRTP
ncbi:hypothetical protein C8R47DRAFT_756178 [Mycena vitilis]|nr:hypothetical protein C8R47DRAFT_756178 [Mycena vitilis]